MNRNFFVDRILNGLFFDTEGGGGLGDVEDIPNTIAGDMEIMNRNDTTPSAGDEGGDDDDPDDDESAGDEQEVETFDTDDKDDEKDDEGEEELDENGNPKVKEDDKAGDEVFKGRPTLTDIKKKYPKIFKEFPELREVLFREQKLSQNFASVEDMETAASKATSFDTIEAALLAGDSSPIVNQLAQHAPEALMQVVDNFLPTVLAKSQDLYLRATVPIIEQFLHSAYTEGKNTNNANLMRSALHAAQFIFGKPEIPDPSRRRGTEGPHPAEQKLQRAQQEWAQTRFKEASSEVSSGIDVELEAEILKGLDPDKKLTERQRTRLIADIKEEIDATLTKDEAFGRSMKALWKRAADANYPKEQRASIKTAFLARAKALVPSVRSRLRAEWFGDKLPNSGKSAGDKNRQGQPPKKRNIPSSGGPSLGNIRRPPTPKDVDYSRTSDMDLIEGRFTRRK